MASGAPRERLVVFVLLPAILVAVGVLAFVTYRTMLALERLRQQAVLEATLELAHEKVDRFDKRILEEDMAAAIVATPDHLDSLADRWIPIAGRQTPTVRGLLVLDEWRTVVGFASRSGGAAQEDEAFRRLLVSRILDELDLHRTPLDKQRHLHKEYGNQSYFLSYWQRVFEGRRYLIVAWHDIGRLVRDVLPSLAEDRSRTAGSKINVVDEQGRIVYGPALRAREFTVGVRFPTTLYGWTLHAEPASADALVQSIESRRRLELVMVGVSCIVIVLGAATILLVAERNRRVSALKSEFVANVSHELKTPLALIRMFAEMLQSGRVRNEDKRREYLDILVSESERLTALIENVLDFARVERGREAYDLVPTDIVLLVTKAATVYRHRCEAQKVELLVECDGDIPLVMADERAVTLAIINLVDNALKYARGSDRIIVRVLSAGKKVHVRVEDFGPGVPEEERERVFERFVRGSTSRPVDKKPVRGTGIGLSLVRHIAEGHGGRAWVASDAANEGATFVISLVPAPPGSRVVDDGEVSAVDGSV